MPSEDYALIRKVKDKIDYLLYRPEMKSRGFLQTVSGRL